MSVTKATRTVAVAGGGKLCEFTQLVNNTSRNKKMAKRNEPTLYRTLILGSRKCASALCTFWVSSARIESISRPLAG